ncbi:MAG TPA: hypothetical protein VGG25_31285 [Streptosporangiaceae bacterium]|jgi:hypothetical protein
MTTGFDNPIIGGGGALVYPAIRSPNFDEATQTGWSIDKNGNAYFYGIVTSGTFEGTNFEINANGQFFYSGTPALGNLTLSIRPTGSAPILDQYGNLAPGGQSFYANSSSPNYSIADWNYGDTATGSEMFLSLGAPRGAPGDPLGEAYAVFGVLVSDLEAQGVIAGNGFAGLKTAAMWEIQGALAAESGLISAGLAAAVTSALFEVQGQLAAESAVAIVGGAAETWHELTLAAGFSAVAGWHTPAYRLNIDGNIELTGRVTGTVATGGSQFSTVPAGYYSASYDLPRPASVSSGTITASSTPRLQIGTGGGVAIYGLTAGTATFDIDNVFMLSAG